MYMCMYECMYMYIFVYNYICIYIYIYIYIFVSICIYIYTYIYMCTYSERDPCMCLYSLTCCFYCDLSGLLAFPVLFNARMLRGDWRHGWLLRNVILSLCLYIHVCLIVRNLYMYICYIYIYIYTLVYMYMYIYVYIYIIYTYMYIRQRALRVGRDRVLNSAFRLLLSNFLCILIY